MQGIEPKPDLLHILHPEGRESFPATRAVFNHYRSDDGRNLFVVHLKCGEGVLRIDEFREFCNPEPWVEVVFHRPADEAQLSAGDVLTLPVGYDYEHDENITNFYYAVHQSLEDVRLEVVTWNGGHARFRFSGVAGAKDDPESMRVMFDMQFYRDPKLTRSFS